MSLTFRVRSTQAPHTTIDVAPTQVILGGYSARSAEERDRHIVELRELGIEPPREVPAFWRVARHLLTIGDAIEVQGLHTSGEVEFALVVHQDRTYVTVASDQTDRELERTSIPRSKQLCPKILGREVVPLGEIQSAWDDVELSSEVSADGEEWLPYQRRTLAALLDPDALVRAASADDRLPDGTVLLSGTIPIIDGITRFLPHFRASLAVPNGPTLHLAYRVGVLEEITPRSQAMA